MHADELRMAVTKVVEILEKTEIRSVVDQYRSAKGDKRTAAAARLGHAGAVIMERLDALSPQERKVTRLLHLDTLGSADYWQDLLSSADEPKRHQASIVHLASRVMFACSHLPNIANLLSSVNSSAQGEQKFVPTVEAGEGVLNIRLTDAGERASDPDRLARSIDGIDMLYSACASIARKPAMDLRLDGVGAKQNRDRDLQFTGERDSIAAVYAVIDSIPAALADIDPEQDIDLDAIVQSLPIFEDLNTLASLGTFSKKDLKDISDTMHQGALLTLESGVILVGTGVATGSLASPANEASGAHDALAMPVVGAPREEAARQSPEAMGERDEHYDRYLREREAMLQPEVASGVNGHAAERAPAERGIPSAEMTSAEEQSRREAVDDLLKSLGQSRSS